MNIKIKIAAIAKDEAAYIPFWVHHHLYFGFDELEIWVNNTTDNSLEILERIKKTKAMQVKYKLADSDFLKCVKKGISFQVYAYEKIYEKALKSKDFTHILFLDLDELWTPKDFSSSVKEVIRKNYIADAISFQWFFDSPDKKRKPFSENLKKEIPLYKDRNVKTIIKISQNVEKLDIHNHIIKNGLYVMHDGSVFNEESPDQHARSLVSTQTFEKGKNIIDDYFIIHQVHRSREEYLATLLRGRLHVNDGRVLKSNREGYIDNFRPEEKLMFEVDEIKHKKYTESFSKFKLDKYLPLLLREAEKETMHRFQEVVNHVHMDPSLISEYKKVFRGVKLNDLTTPHLDNVEINYSIDKVTLSSNELSIIIHGWAYDYLSDNQLEIEVVINNSLKKIPSKVVFFVREDVVKIHPDAHRESGFHIKIKIIDIPLDLLVSEKNLFSIGFKTKYGVHYISLEDSKRITDDILNFRSTGMAKTIPAAPIMPTETINKMKKMLKNKISYLEYGSGGSTVLAAESGILNIVSTESDT